MATKRTIKNKSLAYMEKLEAFADQVDGISRRRSADGNSKERPSLRDCADAIEAVQTRFTMLDDSGVDPALLEIGKLFRRFLETDRKKYELDHRWNSDRDAYYSECVSAKGILGGVLSVMFGDREAERTDGRRTAALNRNGQKVNALIEERNELAHRFGVKMNVVRDAYREKGWLD